MNIEALRYPVGRFEANPDPDSETLDQWIKTIAEFPGKLAKEVEGLQSEELSWHYRPEGWTIRQVVHHCADSHMNSLIRFKLALTEDRPVIKPYEEAKWAELPDGNNDNIEDSLMILRGVHARWTLLLRSIREADWKKEIVHPEYGKAYSIDEFLGSYDWHCRHHLQHVIQAKMHKGKF